MAPVWEQGVSMMGAGTGPQTESFLCGSQGSKLGGAEGHIMNCIVSRDAICITTTAKFVVPEMVNHSMVLWAEVGTVMKGDT